MDISMDGCGLKKLLQAFWPDGFFRHPRHEGRAFGLLLDDFADELNFAAPSGHEQRIVRTAFGEALIDDPCERLDLSAAQVVL